MIRATVERIIPAPPEVVFAAVADRENHHRIVPGVRGRVLREGFTQRQGLGTLHRIGLFGRVGVVEQVVEFDAPNRFTYRLVSGVPLENHFGEFEFDPVQEGTLVTMTMRTEPPVPLPTVPAGRALAVGLRLFLFGLQRAALQRM
ncbi:SRPBCC family protein [Nocardia brasiliensis]|uniref:SRPBCC family protein n=1 Tax=Nocardia brasiliensis TaxID=37326 RepID=A0A6G9XTX0_NOCBR|nr:SRPBCC family protein [Nocardia brasiliensis]QIS04347.1 SRPBCC family protein [Nocardia brasiliensis]